MAKCDAIPASEVCSMGGGEGHWPSLTFPPLPPSYVGPGYYAQNFTYASV